jgi:hypothetical protein
MWPLAIAKDCVLVILLQKQTHEGTPGEMLLLKYLDASMVSEMHVLAVSQRRMKAGTGRGAETGETGTRTATDTTGASARIANGRGCTPTARLRRGLTSNTVSTMVARRRKPCKRTTGGHPHSFCASLKSLVRRPLTNALHERNCNFPVDVGHFNSSMSPYS